jgi:hypothetical protein
MNRNFTTKAQRTRRKTQNILTTHHLAEWVESELRKSAKRWDRAADLVLELSISEAYARQRFNR